MISDRFGTVRICRGNPVRMRREPRQTDFMRDRKFYVLRLRNKSIHICKYTKMSANMIKYHAGQKSRGFRRAVRVVFCLNEIKLLQGD